MRKTKLVHLDLFGAFSSFVCVLHCALLPFLIAFGYLKSTVWLDSSLTEVILIFLTVSIASYSLISSYFNKHRKFHILAIAISGVLLFIIGLQLSGISHIGMTSLGGILIALAHIWNYRLVH